MLTQDEIDYLVCCEKQIIGSEWKKRKLVYSDWRNRYYVESVDGQYNFTVFARISDVFIENFSVGLVYLPRDVPKSIPLYRCNGRHGEHVNHEHHGFCHIHVTRSDDLEAGKRPGQDIRIVDSYSVFGEALIFFGEECNIINASDYFYPTQMPIRF